jgi:hypothetical protein
MLLSILKFKDCASTCRLPCWKRAFYKLIWFEHTDALDARLLIYAVRTRRTYACMHGLIDLHTRYVA